MIHSQTLHSPVQDTGTFVKKYVNILMLFFPVTSFVLVPSIPGTTITAVFTGLLFFIIPLSPLKEEKKQFYLELLYFFCIIIVLSIGSQFINLVSQLKLTDDLKLINRGDLTKTFYRVSHITQSLSLIAGFIVYGYVKYFADEKTIDYIYWGLRLLCFYGLYEFLLFAATGINGDFVVNRTVGYGNRSASLFQTFSLGGIGLMRLKSYTGEPSMFVFTVFPFWVITFALKRRFDTYLLLGCLLLTFSTTAYFFIMLFMAYWCIYKRHYQVFFYACIAIIVICFVLQLSIFQKLLDALYNFIFGGKIEGDASSSRERGKSFMTQIEFWASLNGFNQAFGVGFGYVRSTDFFSTLLPNNGVIGFLVFTWFVLKNIWLKISVPILSTCYSIGLLIVYLIMMVSVPEFAYPSLWVFIGLGFVLTKASQKPEFKQALIS
ncbi:hypothetical protein SNE25_24180 [Mucilaginibacter sabulilitoris]|uniref:O-antigen ligase domain-containing protein n=1 Tax=Mucilaginibacter sabulilitoris TaxID=1173583 RepID=A0ABZ0TGW5_9SPHI|nr:hypothetical protein [Mucilaginibacter sabulilitoris]WPU92429.1 hypothetical protein SNE25_24180 [Mucilaginibacter sabulilitoris]